MSKFTSEMINDYADKLLIGLTTEEEKMIQDEFDLIDENMDLINKIPNIKDVEPQSYPFDMEMSDARNDEIECEEIPIDTLLRNCDRYEGREIEVPKVVG